jgi:hypothetical protein
MTEAEADAQFVEAVTLYQARRMDEAVGVLAALLSADLGFVQRRPLSAVMAAMVAVWRGDYAQALAVWRTSQGLAGPEVSLRPALAAPWRIPRPARQVAPAPLAIATSIAPKRLEAQQLAIATWRGLGAEVYSVNDPREIAALAPLFPEVRFVAASRTAEPEWGRPYVPIAELLAALDASPATVVGLVNSDILIAPSDALLGALAAETQGALVFGNRIDVDGLENLNGQPMERGFDYFFLRRADAVRFLDNDYYLGLPWWDFWIAIQAMAMGLGVTRLAAPVAFHVKHAQAWSNASFVGFRNRFIVHTAKVLETEPLSPALEYLSALLASYDTRRLGSGTMHDTPDGAAIRASENLAFHMSEFIFSAAQPVTLA